jgi:hypothetical protein
MDAAYSCTPDPEICPDLDIGMMPQPSCCTPTEPCGYELAELDEETKMWFPDAEGFLAELTRGDPNGRCVPESFFFGVRPGLWEHRVEVNGGGVDGGGVDGGVDRGADILIVPECDSYTLLAYILPGCCLPDDTCGLSTDESWPTLEYLAMGTFPFTSPECVSAAELNQQFRDSVTLQTFARIPDTTGTCDYAARAAELPDTE